MERVLFTVVFGGHQRPASGELRRGVYEVPRRVQELDLRCLGSPVGCLGLSGDGIFV